jgi:hypothetical protein
LNQTNCLVEGASFAIGPDNWGVFEEEVDDVQPISIRRRLADTEPCN